MTQEFKGTKGKWATIERYDDKRNQPVIDIDASECYQESIITVWSGLDKGDKIDEETLANAQLIAHASEMLEAIQMNIDKVELSQLDFFKKYGFNLGEIHERNKQLITKATTI